MPFLSDSQRQRFKHVEPNLRCGRLPVLDYAGGIVISRHRTAKDMPAEVASHIQQQQQVQQYCDRIV